MAGDWIKMRVWLSRDPKVIAMAHHIAGHRGFMDWMTDPVRQHCSASVFEHVTLDVTVRVTVTGLLQAWGVTRPDGKQDGDDLVVEKSDLDTLDAIAGFPGFGEAMAYVGWAIEDQERHRVRFPNFFSQNASTEELRRKKDAERKRRQREREGVGTSADCHADTSRDSHADVTGKEEKRRVKKNTPQPPEGGGVGFDQFWRVYPRKVAKEAAVKAWRKLKPDLETIDRIVLDVTRRAESDDWTRDKGKYVVYPATYLNGRRWEDEAGPSDVPAMDPEIAARYAASRNGMEDD